MLGARGGGQLLAGNLSPFVLKGLESLSGSEGQIRCLPQPEQLHGLGARTEQGREWMMAQDEVVVVGIDVAKDKVDACISIIASTADVPEHRRGTARPARLIRATSLCADPR